MIRVLILSRELQSIGGVVNLINTLTSNFSQNILYKRFIIGYHIGKNSIYLGSLKTLKDLLRLLVHVKRNKYDIIHINPSLRPFALLRDGLFITALRLIRFTNIIVFIHGWNPITVKKIERNLLLRYLFVNAFSVAKATIVLASRFKSELVDVGFSASNIHVLTSMFSRDIFKGVDQKKRKHRPALLFFSRIIKNKGIYELVDAFAIVRNYYPDLKLIIAGDGPDFKVLSEYVYKKILKKSVIFTGYIRNSEKAKILLATDIFILPSYDEGCPVSLLEAMAAGSAVIASAVGGIPDVITDEVNGILLKDLDPSHIAAAIKRLLEDRELRDKIQANNRRKAWDNYEAKMVTNKIENIYKAVIEDVRKHG